MRIKKNAAEILLRGWKCLCPACGRATVFEDHRKLFQQCPACGIEIKAREENAWFFMYMSTAFITGIFLLLMFLVPRPEIIAVRVLLILIASAVFFISLPLRKSLGLAVDYLFE